LSTSFPIMIRKKRKKRKRRKKERNKRNRKQERNRFLVESYLYLSQVVFAVLWAFFVKVRGWDVGGDVLVIKYTAIQYKTYISSTHMIITT
jgi:hypothetical protein